jgi:hypothetical protein
MAGEGSDMNFLDWFALATMLGALIGAQVLPDPNVELERTTLAQQAQVQTSSAIVLMGGQPVMRFSDSGSSTAYERAIEAKQNLQKVIEHHDLPAHYLGLGLRLGGDSDLVTLNYLDMRITSITRADAALNQTGTPHELAERWKASVENEIHALPNPIPDTWIGAAGQHVGSLLVSDPTLAQAVADCLPDHAGQRVTVKAEAGTVTLDGQVADDNERGRLERMVRQIPGVRDVVNRTSITAQ